MARLPLSVLGILAGAVAMLIGSGGRQLAVPEVPLVVFRSLGPLSPDVSLALAIGGIVAVLSSLILGTANPRAVAALRYSGVLMLLAGVFVDGLRVPAKVEVHFNLISPVPSNLMVGLTVMGILLLAAGVITLVRSAQPGQIPRGKHR